MQYLYLLIILFLVVFIILNMFEKKSILAQIDAALVLVTLLLRLMLIK